MRELIVSLSREDGPVYVRLANALRSAVEEGRLQPGELLPSTRTLARQIGVHRHTVMTALDELVAEGWLVAERGRGYRVVANLPVEFFQVSAAPRRETRGLRQWQPAVEVPAVRSQATGAEFAFPSGQPDLRLFPADEFYGHIREVLRSSPPAQLLAYGSPEGSPALLAELRTYLRRLRGICDGEVIVTHGSQEAIFLLGKLLLAPGDRVAVEEMGYPPAWGALRVAGARLEALPLDADGVDPDALERLARRVRVRMAYVTPLHQYPTTATLPLERRARLYEVADRYGIALLEDDYDHEFHYRCRPVAPIKSRDPAGLVLYVSTFSKVVYPSARLGFAVVPPALRESLAGLKRVVSRQNDSLQQEAMARWMASGGFERHLRRMRRCYERRLCAMAQALESRGYGGAFRKPDGGMSLWVDFRVPSRELARRAAARGVDVRPAAEFRLDGAETTFLRLGFASSDEEEIAQGMLRLSAAARGD
ncbi:MAG: PLP-dependent aminotransferase family protein [Armatimonadetes bacterium]|nr:PLP-dependent aminotransferase family protein [Armatimonadota bacterium]